MTEITSDNIYNLTREPIDDIIQLDTIKKAIQFGEIPAITNIAEFNVLIPESIRFILDNYVEIINGSYDGGKNILTQLSIPEFEEVLNYIFQEKDALWETVTKSFPGSKYDKPWDNGVEKLNMIIKRLLTYQDAFGIKNNMYASYIGKCYYVDAKTIALLIELDTYAAINLIEAKSHFQTPEILSAAYNRTIKKYNNSSDTSAYLFKLTQIADVMLKKDPNNVCLIDVFEKTNNDKYLTQSAKDIFLF